MVANEPAAALSQPTHGTKPFAWSVRRELWDNPSIYFAPLIAAGVVLLGYFVTAYRLPQMRRTALLLDPTRTRAAIEMPYDLAAIMIMFTAYLVALLYSLDALHGERRDRSILFWKSMPVSDRTSVLAKAFVPLAIVPLVTFVVIIATQWVMLLTSSAVLAPAGLAGTTWANLSLFRWTSILFYGLVTSVLWAMPVYGWLLLVGAYARRATFLWAILPWLSLCAIERLIFGSSYLSHMVSQRVFGNYELAFHEVQFPKGTHAPMVDRLAHLDPVGFFTSPSLWLGLVATVVFLVGAIYLRRSRGPI